MGVPAVDVVVVGSGPNGLAAALTMARAGLDVLVLEAQPTLGGGARTLDLGLADGVVHDLCSAVHPMAWASPFFHHLGLADRVDLLVPEASYAQPLDGGRAAVAYRDLARTADGLGADGPAWHRLFAPLAERWRDVVGIALGDRRSVPPGLGPAGMPTVLRFGLGVLEQGGPAWGARLRTEPARALLTGAAAHAISPLPSLGAAGTALLLGTLAHAGQGWPVVRGGSGAITAAMLAELTRLGGRVRTQWPVRTEADLPPARCYLFDTTPRTLVQVLGGRLPARTRRALAAFPYGSGVAKVDLVTDAPVPWADPAVGLAGTVHLGGTRAEMVRAEAAVAAGRHAERPMVLLSDPARLDAGREVAGLRPVWTYAHVPAGSDRDMTAAVLAQVERFAPGFRDTVVAVRCVPAARMSGHNANYVGGDIAAGSVSLRHMLARPTARVDPYSVGLPGVYLCSASTPPGPGVHGLGGWNAARRALRDVFGYRSGYRA
ncbi:phytoene desaturase family protein [Cellulomonas hominis]